MQKLIGMVFMAATLSFCVGAASADEQVSEVRSVDARAVRIKLGGNINLNLRQGPMPSLVLFGEKRLVSKVITSQRGDTLEIDTEKSSHLNFGNGKHRLRAELVLPNLNELLSLGVGVTEVKGFSGEAIRLALDGAGSVTFDSRYRTVDARLGGAGSMTLDVGDSERIDLDLRGAGQIDAKGGSRLLRAKLSGVGNLDAQALRADTVDLDMTGLGGAAVYAITTAKVRLTGFGSATVYGKPANRSSTARGLGSVSWE